MKLHASADRSSKILAAVFAACSVVLGSCGGGGGGNNNDSFVGGDVRVLPNPGTFYAGIPSTLTFVGGRKPYAIASSDPTVIQVPPSINTTFLDVIPNNPGVIDAGLEAGEVPRRTLRISMRDQNGRFNDAEIAVLQNFLTGYGLIFTSDCGAAAGTTPPQACVGGETIITAIATTNGTRFGNRIFRFEVIRGAYQFVSPEVPTNVPPVLLNTYTTNTDHTGAAIARIRVSSTATPSLVTIRLIDVATGVYADTVFLISPGPPIGTITLIPGSLTFTGNLSTDCGGGSSDILIQGGLAPFTIIPPQNIFVNQTTVPAGNPTKFNVTVPAAVAPCPTYAPVIVQDSQGRTAQLAITSAAGTGTLPPLAVAPASVDLGNTCGFTASVSVVGGTGSYNTSSTNPAIVAGAGGSTVSIRRRPDDFGAPAAPATGTISITDGTSIATVSVTNIAAVCP